MENGCQLTCVFENLMKIKTVQTDLF